MEDLTGKQLGIYQVVCPLGEGGMAAVYKAYQASIGRYVAIKVLPKYFAVDPNFVHRFVREAKVIAQLEHPHILPVYDFGEEDGYSYLVMRYVHGGDLAAQLTKAQPTFTQANKILFEISSALDYSHSRDVVHRDIKPSNVLVDEQGNCLLSDFGLAKIISADSRFTTSGTFIGTPTYASPEQCMGLEVDCRTDIYSLGIILYEMYTGRPPFRAETPMGIVLKHINDPLPSPRSLNPNISIRMARVIQKALAKKPEDRFQTAGELVEAIREESPDQGRSLPFSTKRTEDSATAPVPMPGMPADSQEVPRTLPKSSGRTKSVEIFNRKGSILKYLAPFIFILLAAAIFLATKFPTIISGSKNTETETSTLASPIASIPTNTSTLPSTEPLRTAINAVVLEPTATNTAIPQATATETPLPTPTLPVISTPMILTEKFNLDCDEPTFSPDGREILFVCADKEWNRYLYLIDIDGTNQRFLDKAGSKVDRPSFSPDGKFIIFATLPKDNTEQEDLWVIDKDNNNPQNITNTPDYSEGRVSFIDSDTIVYDKSPRGKPSEANICIAKLNPDQSIHDEVQITSKSTGSMDGKPTKNRFPSYSKQTKMIYFRSEPANIAGASTIWAVNLGGGDITRISPDKGFFPAVSNDGKWLLFIPTEKDKIWAFDLENMTKNPYTVLLDDIIGAKKGSPEIGMAEVSPDHQVIAYSLTFQDGTKKMIIAPFKIVTTQ